MSVLHQWERGSWERAFGALSAAGPPWVCVRAMGPEALATVLPWGPADEIRYDARGDGVEVATREGVHRSAHPLAVFALDDGRGVYRVVVVRYDGGLDVVDVMSPPPIGEGPDGDRAGAPTVRDGEGP